MHLSCIQQNLINLEKIGIVVFIKVHYNAFLPTHVDEIKSWMNFIHDNVGDNANFSVGDDFDDDGGENVNKLLWEIIYDNTF
jgi:hypothetical protein